MHELFQILLLISTLPNQSEKRFRFEIIIHAAPRHRIFYGGKSGRIPLSGISLIKKWEGFTAKAEPDPLSGSPITIGWGATRKRDGSKWHMGDHLTRREADDLLIYQLENIYLPNLQKIPIWQKLDARQQGALLSFSYNLGEDFYGHRGFNRITKCLRDKDWKHIKQIMLLYRNPGSNVERGLRARRENEAEIFLAKN